MKLIYINELGPNYKGDNIYEFIFSQKDNIWGENWDVQPAVSNPNPPDFKLIEKVGILKNSEIVLTLAQNSDFFGMTDVMDGVLALGWESDESEYVLNDNLKRLVFQFGDDIKSVEDKLYERDIVLSYEKNFAENEYRQEN